MTEAIQNIIILSGGELSTDVAADLQTKLEPMFGSRIQQVPMAKSKLFKASLLEDESIANQSTLAIFIAVTIENELPPEDAGACIRFFKRKTHPDDFLAGKVQYAVLGLGDSNLLLDRQHTAAKDCNQVAQALDSRLEALGGTRFCPQGEADERTGLTEIEPWINMLIDKLKA